MFISKYFDSNETKLDNIESIVGKIGTQTRIQDISTGIYTRILTNDNENFTFCESGDSPRGFLGSIYGSSYPFPSRTLRNLNKVIKENIDGITLSLEEVNAIIENGFLNILLKKNPELAKIEGFAVVLCMENFEKEFEKSHIVYSNVSSLITQMLKDESLNLESRQALETLKSLYEHMLFKQSKKNDYEHFSITSEQKHSSQEIAEDLKEIGRISLKDSTLQEFSNPNKLNIIDDERE